ncbi:MAG: hypothetical protein Q9225_007974 [Loekoesia sp. 1 TL-2023]
MVYLSASKRSIHGKEEIEQPVAAWLPYMLKQNHHISSTNKSPGTNHQTDIAETIGRPSDEPTEQSGLGLPRWGGAQAAYKRPFENPRSREALMASAPPAPNNKPVPVQAKKSFTWKQKNRQARAKTSNTSTLPRIAQEAHIPTADETQRDMEHSWVSDDSEPDTNCQPYLEANRLPAKRKRTSGKGKGREP